MKLSFLWEWNPFQNTLDENVRWCHLSSIEWDIYPIFLSQPIAPILFLFFPWYWVILAIVVLNWAWRPLRYKCVNLTIANIACLPVTFLKYPIGVGVGIYLWTRGQHLAASISILWPFVAWILFLTVRWPRDMRGIQKLFKLFMDKLGYDGRIQILQAAMDKGAAQAEAKMNQLFKKMEDTEKQKNPPPDA